MALTTYAYLTEAHRIYLSAMRHLIRDRLVGEFGDGWLDEGVRPALGNNSWRDYKRQMADRASTEPEELLDPYHILEIVRHNYDNAFRPDFPEKELALTQMSTLVQVRNKRVAHPVSNPPPLHETTTFMMTMESILHTASLPNIAEDIESLRTLCKSGSKVRPTQTAREGTDITGLHLSTDNPVVPTSPLPMASYAPPPMSWLDLVFTAHNYLRKSGRPAVAVHRIHHRIRRQHMSFRTEPDDIRGLMSLISRRPDLFVLDSLSRDAQPKLRLSDLTETPPLWVAPIVEAIKHESRAGEWAAIGDVEKRLNNRQASWLPENTECKTLVDVVEAFPDLIEVRDPGLFRFPSEANPRLRVAGADIGSRTQTREEDNEWTGLVVEAMRDQHGEGDWVYVNSLGRSLSKVDPAWDHRSYGFETLSELLRTRPDLFDFRLRQEDPSDVRRIAYVRLVADQSRVRTN